MKESLNILVRCPLFAGISQQDLEPMLACLGAKPQRYRKGETIMAEGEAAGQLGVVLDGAVQVVRHDYDGNRSMMGRLEATDLFAETFACAGVEEMPVDVIAAENTQVLLIDAKRLTRTCGGSCGFHHQMIYNLMRILAGKNLAFNRKLEITSRRSTREKLMAYLMMEAKHAGSDTFVIPYDRQELADYLEVDRSGLSAEISKLRREGVLACERSRFTLLSIARETES